MISQRSYPHSPAHTPRYSDADLEAIANYLLKSLTDIERVYVYRSKGASSGTIVLVTSEDSVSDGFIKFSSICMEKAAGSKMTADQVRFDAFEQLYPDFAVWRKKEQIDYGSESGAFVDILICPPDWQKKAGELSVSYYHPTHYYLEKISKYEPLLVA